MTIKTSVPIALAVLILLVGTFALYSCVSSSNRGSGSQQQPESEESWRGAGGGFREWGATGEYIFGVSIKPIRLDTWKWEGGLLKRQKSVEASFVKDAGAISWLTSGRLLFCPNDYNLHPIVIMDVEKERVLQEWNLGKYWYCSIIGTSRNGEYAAVGVFQNTGPRDYNHPRVRIGLISPKVENITWLPTLIGKHRGYDNIESIVPSDDGRYVAVAGWNNGAVVVDVANKKILWEIRPKEAVALKDIVFSLDNKVVYTGGGEGCVYGMDVPTGKILSRWFATETGKSIYGHRISTVAVSPDGNLVAVGTGPEGLVYIWESKTGKKVKVLDHGGSTILILSFSPDSKTLATFAAGKIKTWSLSSF